MEYTAPINNNCWINIRMFEIDAGALNVDPSTERTIYWLFRIHCKKKKQFLFFSEKLKIILLTLEI